MWFRSLVLLLLVTGSATAASSPTLPGARAYVACGAAGLFWPTATLAVTPGAAWVACKEERRIVRVPLASGRVRSIPLGGDEVIAVATGLGAVWSLDVRGTISRIDPRSARITGRIATGSARPYNLWVGAGSLWSVDDASGEVVRIDPARRAVTARIRVGDGPSDLVFARTRAWIVNHRDRGLVSLDATTNRTVRLSTLPGDAPERIALLEGSLWVTGRGTDLLRVDPATGEVRATIEIGAGGIDVVTAGGALWVPARSAASDRRGFPTMAALLRVASTGAVTTVSRATRRVDVHGLVPLGRGVLLADNTKGTLYRIAG